MFFRRLAPLAAPLVLGALVWSQPAAPAQAQVALPTAPAASRTDAGVSTAARASAPGDAGSPLEPYLVLWLLPVSGVLAVAFATVVDRQIRAQGVRR